VVDKGEHVGEILVLRARALLGVSAEAFERLARRLAGAPAAAQAAEEAMDLFVAADMFGMDGICARCEATICGDADFVAAHAAELFEFACRVGAPAVRDAAVCSILERAAKGGAPSKKRKRGAPRGILEAMRSERFLGDARSLVHRAAAASAGATLP
jgi:hypothetical protein